MLALTGTDPMSCSITLREPKKAHSKDAMVFVCGASLGRDSTLSQNKIVLSGSTGSIGPENDWSEASANDGVEAFSNSNMIQMKRRKMAVKVVTLYILLLGQTILQLRRNS